MCIITFEPWSNKLKNFPRIEADEQLEAPGKLLAQPITGLETPRSSRFADQKKLRLHRTPRRNSAKQKNPAERRNRYWVINARNITAFRNTLRRWMT